MNDQIEALVQNLSAEWVGAGLLGLLVLIVLGIGIRKISDPERKKARKAAQKQKERQRRFQLITSDVESIDGMEGHDFELFCARLLTKNGFENVLVTQGSGDQGVDILAEKDDIRYAIQCKNYAPKLGNGPVQEIYAGKVFYHCHVGVVMTNTTFTQSAQDLAEATNVILWDRDRLQEFMDEAE
jgi:HJR/Mrr/RecB family endonuclease